jgi:uncharacterized protein
MSPDRDAAAGHTDDRSPDSSAPDLEPQPVERPMAGGSDVIPYAAPMFAYVALGGLEGYLPAHGGQPSPFWYPLAYAIRVALVAILCWHYRATWNDFRPWPKMAALVLAVLVGVVVWGLWIGLDGRYPPIPLLGKRGGFDAGTLAPRARLAFVAVRMLGLVILVPLIEELFWRSFLMRWLIDPDFHKVPVGRVTAPAAAITSVMFALAHPEWLPAVITGALWAWLLWQTRSLAACAVSHATANLALSIYVIATGDWKYW